jgi:thiol-disulfide isomerase/thioredoxin
MNKKILLILVTAFLLACNALFPQPSTPTATPQPPTLVPPTETAVPPTELVAQPTESPLPPTASTGFTIVRLHPWDGDLHELLAQEAQKAIAVGQMPIAEFDATWCPPCLAIEEALDAKNELMLTAYAGTYIIKLDVDEWGWTENGVQDFKFDGIPVYFKLDAQGKQTGEVIDGNAWGDNIPENIAPPMDEFFHGK